jgi:hypothetical protein
VRGKIRALPSVPNHHFVALGYDVVYRHVNIGKPFKGSREISFRPLFSRTIRVRRVRAMIFKIIGKINICHFKALLVYEFLKVPFNESFIRFDRHDLLFSGLAFDSFPTKSIISELSLIGK